MSERTDLDRVLGTWLRAEAPSSAPDDLLGPVFDVTSASRPLPTWQALLSVSPMRSQSTVLVGSPILRLTRVAFVALILGLLAVVGSVLAGSSRDTTPPAGIGLIAYESGGDIHIGEPATGETRAIVTGPAFEARPIFSPDGTHIAFYRSPTRLPEEAWAPATASILVVESDGSDERVIVPAGFSSRLLGGFSWTPDGGALVVQLDFLPNTYPCCDGELGLFDVFGVAQPRVLTPPLPKAPGAYHPQIGGEVAPMFRPPTGDRILNIPDASATSTLVEMNIDGSNVIEVIDPVQGDLPFEIIAGVAWSPDATWIALLAYERCRQPEPEPYGCMETWSPNPRVYVISGDGQEVRRLTRAPDDVDPGRHINERAIAWSPDGSRILIDRTTAEYLDVAALATETFTITGQTLVVDVASGAERAVTGITTGKWGPPYGPPRAGGDNGIEWVPSSTSSWSPDGRSVLVSEGPGTRPLVIDVETGAVTRLPWETDWHPSWRLAD
jgi:hypothetical protein